MKTDSTPLQLSMAKMLLRTRAFHLQINDPFRFANGWKAPFYLDDRKLLSYTHSRNIIKLEMARLVAENFPDADVIAGIANNAIAHGTMIADALSMPFVYVYHEPKTYGLENQIEGDLRPRQKVVLVENQVLTGYDAERAIEVVRANGSGVMGLITLYDYQLAPAAKRLRKADVPVLALTNHNAIIEAGQQLGLMSDEEIEIIRKWHTAPSKWNK